jgi:glucose/arabinose dehydrogenase
MDNAGKSGRDQIQYFYGKCYRQIRLDSYSRASARNFGANSTMKLSTLLCRVLPALLTPELAWADLTHRWSSNPRATAAPPVAGNDTVGMHRGQKARIAVLANDTGSINNNTVTIQTPPNAGSVIVESTGFVRYTNTSATAANDSFRYTVSGSGGTSQPATVSINFSNALRISNPRLAMPAAAPETFWQISDAFPNATFSQPLCLVSIPGDIHRLFICERMAKIQLIPDVTATQGTRQLFLDLQQVVAGRTPAETVEDGVDLENGLLGLAFHPNYASNGFFYVAYTVRIAGGAFYQRISRFKVSAGNPNLADPASELVLLQQLDDGPNHNGGDLHFGPDGYLYYGAGDEQAQYDVFQNSQKIDKDFFSGIFRIDVDKRAGNRAPNAHSAIPRDNGQARFSVPADNPFIHTSLGGTWDGKINGVTVPDLSKVRTEFWAFGFRHPWRFSFDSANGGLWVGEVGQDNYEEIDLVQKGGNYGWVYREGFHDTNFTNPPPPPKPAGFTSINPVYEYVHAGVPGGDAQFQGNSVVGGVVYRGSRFPELYGAYIFSDSWSGNIWRRNATSGVVERLTGVPGAFGGIVAMGSDPSNHDVLFADYQNGRILRLLKGTVTATFPATLTETNLFADLADLSPNPGLLPYEPNLPFWSDYATKRRWFGIPNPNARMTWSRDQNWTFPSGMLWVKQFDLELTRGNPATKRRIETRVLVKTATGAYGVSYRWNDTQTEATLAPDQGVDFDINVVENGVSRTQRWQIPSRASCLTCHTPQAGHALSFTTRQMNSSNVINGFAGNQLTVLQNGNYFSNVPDSPNILPRHVGANETAYPVETRVRSYFAVNCAYCHHQGGTGNGIWDGRAHLTLAQTQLVNGAVENNGGDPANRLVVPGSTAHSIVYNRIAATNGFTRMPPLATSELDHADIALLQTWITASLPTRQSYDQWRQTQFGSLTSANGDPLADPDGDGRNNSAEFLGLTNPLSGATFFAPKTMTGFGNMSVIFQAPANRWATVETSTDLRTWSIWDVPGNSGNVLNGTNTLNGPKLNSKQFFRVKLQEN